MDPSLISDSAAAHHTLQQPQRSLAHVASSPRYGRVEASSGPAADPLALCGRFRRAREEPVGELRR